MPEISVNDPRSAMNGSAVRTRLIWPIAFEAKDFAHCSSVACSSGAGKTSPAAHATASKALARSKRARRLFASVRSASRSAPARGSAHLVTARLKSRFDRGADGADSEQNDPHGFLLMPLVRRAASSPATPPSSARVRRLRGRQRSARAGSPPARSPDRAASSERGPQSAMMAGAGSMTAASRG